MKYKYASLAFITLILFICITGCIPNPKSQDQESSTKPKNLLFVIVDDLNISLGTYGHPLVKTPNIDKLAAQGVQFNHAYCNYSICGPSRASLLTGLLPETIGVLRNNVPIQSVIGDRISLPHLFKQNGFETINVGKIFHKMRWDIDPFQDEYNDIQAWDKIYHFESTDLGNQGEARNMTDSVLQWCYWRAAEGTDEDQQDGRQVAKAVQLIKQKRDKPLFLALGIHKPHDPFVAPKKYFELYPLEECSTPKVPESWSPAYPFSYGGWTAVFNKFTEKDKREFLRSYYACTSFMDAQVGKVMDALKESGQLDNTVVVFFGDHGYHLGEHQWWNKVTLHQLGTNAPFIIMDPTSGIKAYKTDAMIEFIDIYPTLAELFELKAPEYLEGKSFAEVLRNPAKPFRTEVRSIVQRGNFIGRMVKNEKYRFISWDESKRGSELYDQIEDPLEYNNLAQDSSYATLVNEMMALIDYGVENKNQK